MSPSKFRRTSESEKWKLSPKSRAQAPRLRSLDWVVRRRKYGPMNTERAFDSVVQRGSGICLSRRSYAQAPQWMQLNGLEWVFRLSCEPRRLWRRYLLLNPLYLSLLFLQVCGFEFATSGLPPSQELLFGRLDQDSRALRFHKQRSFFSELH